MSSGKGDDHGGTNSEAKRREGVSCVAFVYYIYIYIKGSAFQVFHDNQ